MPSRNRFSSTLSDVPRGAGEDIVFSSRVAGSLDVGDQLVHENLSGVLDVRRAEQGVFLKSGVYRSDSVRRVFR